MWRNRFTRRRENICAGLFTQTWEVCDVIRVAVRKQNQLHIQFVVFRRAQHRLGISSSIDGCRHARLWVPNKVSVNGHAVVIGGEFCEAIQRFDFLRAPFAAGNFAKRATVQA